MSSFLIKQGNTYSVKVAIPADVQHIIGKRAFKHSLKTSDPKIADALKGRWVLEFKRQIEEARGNPTQHLEGYLEETSRVLRKAKSDTKTPTDAIAGVEFELLDKLLAARKVSHIEELPEAEQEKLIETYKITTGQFTPIAAHLEEYTASRSVEEKTAAKDKHAIGRFAKRVSLTRDVDKRAVRDFVRYLSDERGLKPKTIKDNISSLRNYWGWLQDNSIVDEDRINPFSNVTLPKENRKDAAEAERVSFSIEDIQQLSAEINAKDDEALQAVFGIAIYTGCRIEEIAQLRTINVTDKQIEIVRAKTKSGNRIIPVHDALRPLVLSLLGSGGDYLIPNLTQNKFGIRSTQVGKRFGSLKQRLGFDKRHVFHCIRRTVITQLQHANVPEAVTADIVGHEIPTMTYGTYAGGSSFAQKYEAIMKLDYGLLSEVEDLK